MFNIDCSRQLVVIRDKSNCNPDSSANGLLRFALSNAPLADIVVSRLCTSPLSDNGIEAVIAVPQGFNIASDKASVESYNSQIPVCFNDFKENEETPWFIISNGRFIIKNSCHILQDVLADISADVLMVNVEPGLLAYREKVRLISENKIATFYRRYIDSAEPASLPDDWPGYIFIRSNVCKDFFDNYALTGCFSDFMQRCQSLLKVCAVNIAGVSVDLDSENGLFDFCNAYLNSLSAPQIGNISDSKASNVKLLGKVLIGENVELGSDTVIAGPTIICNGAKIGNSAVINSSIIGSDISVPKEQILFSRIVKDQKSNWKMLSDVKTSKTRQSFFADLKHLSGSGGEFKNWPRFSYPVFLKRIADIIASLAVLILFAPVFPVIALVIKMTSRGPVFFKDRRQGLGGKEFNCIKFRTMMVGADKIQSKLRCVNQLDGPQFKIDDDPRISSVGKFLRDTCIDEIPQFFNVLLGQMSLVGPRPSPQSENTIRPSWRYVRLSVRPGITGLWQVCRTREVSKDFQEWIYYDTKYVRTISLKTDLWICWRTALHMIRSFVKQF